MAPLVILPLSWLLIIMIVLLRKQKIFIRKTINLPPGPPALPLIGTYVHRFNFNSLCQLSKKYGPLMSMRFGSVPVLIISSARLAKEALKTNDLAFSGRPEVLVLKKMSYNCLDFAFSPYSDYWREMRKICVLHLFNLKRVQSFRSIREDEVSQMIRKIAKLAASSRLVNLTEMSMNLTSTITWRVGFGRSFDEGSDSKRFRQLFHRLQVLVASMFCSDFFPSLSWVDRISGKLGRLFRIFILSTGKFWRSINKKKSKTSSEEDMVDILLKLRDEKSFPVDLTLNHIKAVLMNVLLGGTETGATIPVWLMTAVMQNPLVMEKVQVEIRRFVGKKGMVYEDDIEKLHYLQAVVKETLRLYPPNPLLVPRQTIAKCYIDGYEIQPETLVFVNAWAIARDPEHWKNPDEFWPERFLDSAIDYRGLDFEFIPFGAGRRGCPGILMGMATVELALANLLYSFDWELPFGIKKEGIDAAVCPGCGWTLKPKSDLIC